MCSPRANWGPALEENQYGRYAKHVTTFDKNVQDVYAVSTDDKHMNGVYKKEPLDGIENKSYVADPNEPQTKF